MLVLRDLYPPLEALHHGFLPVSELHTIYYEVSGNPAGKPVIVLHGGPGGGSQPKYRQYFDPARWQIIQFDQRGCGQSLPHAELRENTTWDLVADIERLRQHLGIEQWHVFGGSWGSTLSLAYGVTHPERCLGFVLRGIFMLRPAELHWFYQHGASEIFPDAWEAYLEAIPVAERDDLMAAYYRRLTSEDAATRLAAATAWSQWEASTSKLLPDRDLVARFGQSFFAEAFARIESHYFVNRGFFEEPNYLLNRVERIRHLQGVIIQGRYDVVCPARSAWDLHRAWPEAQLEIIADAGHAMSEPGIRSALIRATDAMADLP